MTVIASVIRGVLTTIFVRQAVDIELNGAR